MKKIVFIIIGLLLLCGCNNKEKVLVCEKTYGAEELMNKTTYTIYFENDKFKKIDSMSEAKSKMVGEALCELEELSKQQNSEKTKDEVIKCTDTTITVENMYMNEDIINKDSTKDEVQNYFEKENQCTCKWTSK